MVNAIGVSNFDAPLLRELYDIANKRISVVQNWMDPFKQDVETRKFCSNHKIAYMAYSSLGTQWEMKIGHNPVFADPTLQAIATKHGTISHFIYIHTLFIQYLSDILNDIVFFVLILL